MANSVRRLLQSEEGLKGAQSKAGVIGAVVAVVVVLVLALTGFLLYRCLYRKRYWYQKLEDSNHKLEFKSLMHDRSPTHGQKIRSGYIEEQKSSSSSSEKSHKESVFKPYHLNSIYNPRNEQGYQLVQPTTNGGSTVKPFHGGAFNLLNTKLQTGEKADHSNSGKQGLLNSVTRYFNNDQQQQVKYVTNANEVQVNSYTTDLGALKNYNQQPSNDDLQESLQVMKQKLAYLQDQRQHLETKSQLMTNASVDNSYKDQKSLLLQGMNINTNKISTHGDQKNSNQQIQSQKSNNSNQSPFSYIAQSYTPAEQGTFFKRADNKTEREKSDQPPLKNDSSSSQPAKALEPSVKFGPDGKLNQYNVAQLNQATQNLNPVAQNIGMQFKGNMSQMQQQYLKQTGINLQENQNQGGPGVKFAQNFAQQQPPSQAQAVSKEMKQRSRDDSELNSTSTTSTNSQKKHQASMYVNKMQKAQLMDQAYNASSARELKVKGEDDPVPIDPDNSLKKNKSTGNVQGKLENMQAKQLGDGIQYSFKEIVNWIDERLESNKVETPNQLESSSASAQKSPERESHKKVEREIVPTVSENLKKQSSNKQQKLPGSILYETITEENIEDVRNDSRKSDKPDTNKSEKKERPSKGEKVKKAELKELRRSEQPQDKPKSLSREGSGLAAFQEADLVKPRVKETKPGELSIEKKSSSEAKLQKQSSKSSGISEVAKEELRDSQKRLEKLQAKNVEKPKTEKQINQKLERHSTQKEDQQTTEKKERKSAERDREARKKQEEKHKQKEKTSGLLGPQISLNAQSKLDEEEQKRKDSLATENISMAINQNTGFSLQNLDNILHNFTPVPNEATQTRYYDSQALMSSEKAEIPVVEVKGNNKQANTKGSEQAIQIDKEQQMKQEKEQQAKKEKEYQLRKEKEHQLRKEKEYQLKKEKEVQAKKEKEALIKKEKEYQRKKEKEQALKQEKEQAIKKEKEQVIKEEKGQSSRKDKEQEPQSYKKDKESAVQKDKDIQPKIQQKEQKATTKLEDNKALEPKGNIEKQVVPQRLPTEPVVLEFGKPDNSENKFFRKKFSDSLEPSSQARSAVFPPEREPGSGHSIFAEQTFRSSAGGNSSHKNANIPEGADSTQFDIFASLNNFSQSKVPANQDPPSSRREQGSKADEPQSLQFNIGGGTALGQPQAYIASNQSHASLNSSQSFKNRDQRRTSAESQEQRQQGTSQVNREGKKLSNSSNQDNRAKLYEQVAVQSGSVVSKSPSQNSINQLNPQASIQSSLSKEGSKVKHFVAKAEGIVGLKEASSAKNLLAAPQEASKGKGDSSSTDQQGGQRRVVQNKISGQKSMQVGEIKSEAELARTKSHLGKGTSKDLQKDKHILKAIIDEQNRQKQLNKGKKQQEEPDDLTAKVGSGDVKLLNTQSDIGDQDNSISKIFKNIIQKDEDNNQQLKAGGGGKVQRGMEEDDSLHELPNKIKVKSKESAKGDNSILGMLEDKASGNHQRKDTYEIQGLKDNQLTPVVTPPAQAIPERGYGSAAFDAKEGDRLQSLMLPDTLSTDIKADIDYKSQSAVVRNDHEVRNNNLAVTHGLEEPYERPTSRKDKGERGEARSGIMNALSLSKGAEQQKYNLWKQKSMGMQLEEESLATKSQNFAGSKPQKGNGIMRMMSLSQKSKK